MSDNKPEPQSAIEPPGEGAKERIAAAAVRLFCQKGYEAASVREIVEAAGVTKPTLYYYFQNKEAVFKAIVTEALTGFTRKLEYVCSRRYDSFADQLRALEAIYLDGAREQPELVRFIHAVFFSGLHKDQFDFEARWQENMEMIFSIFDAAHKRGDLRRDVPAGMMALRFVGLAETSMKLLVFCPDMIEDIQSPLSSVELFMEGAGPRN